MDVGGKGTSALPFFLCFYSFPLQASGIPLGLTLSTTTDV